MTDQPADRTEAPRRMGPGVFHAGVMAAALVVLAAFLLTAPSGPPLAIAAISPQAVAQIKKAPPQQATKDGTATTGRSGQGGVGGRGNGASPSAGPGKRTRLPVAQRPPGSSFICSGNPPRQIEDPQSPPCIPFWSGDNGGATWKGVTATTVRIALPSGSGNARLVSDFEAFFNDRFQFYGRHLQLVDNSADFTGDPVVGQQAAAEKAASQHKVFASTDTEWNGGIIYRQALAKKGVLSTGTQQQFTEEQMRAHAPYMWQYPMSNDSRAENTAEWMCNRLVGQPAHAGAGTGLGGPRKFGAIIENLGGIYAPFPVKDFQRAVAGCGVTLDDSNTVISNNAYAATPSISAESQQGILKLRQNNVDSIICFCYVAALPQYLAYAQSNAYSPEWVYTDYYLGSVPAYIAQAPATQSQNLLGINFEPRNVAMRDDAGMFALNSVDPGAWGTAANDGSVFRAQLIGGIYHDLLLLASGIQMAGPNLTPKTFERALQTTVFPNPLDRLSAYLNEGFVGFENGSHSMTTKGVEWWWSPTTQGPFTKDTPGAFCYLGGSRRYNKGTWPKGGDPFFKGTCDAYPPAT